MGTNDWRGDNRPRGKCLTALLEVFDLGRAKDKKILEFCMKQITPQRAVDSVMVILTKWQLVFGG